MKNNLERFLEDFGIGERSDAAFKSAEYYLVNVIQPNSNCRTFDELRYEMYRIQKKTTCYLLNGHLLRSHYFVNFCLTLEQSFLHHSNSIHSPLNFGWKSVNGILLPNKYLRIMPTQDVTRYSCKKGCTKVYGCKPEHCTKYYKCQRCDNK